MNATSTLPGLKGTACPTLTARAGWMLLAWSFYMCWVGLTGILRMRVRVHTWLHGDRAPLPRHEQGAPSPLRQYSHA